MRFVIVLFFVAALIDVNAQQKFYFDEHDNPTDKKNAYYYIQKITKNKKCRVVEFYTANNTRKRDSECRSTGADTYEIDGIDQFFSEEGKPLYTIVRRPNSTPLFAQYWQDGLPALVYGNGVVKVEDDDGNIRAMDIRDSLVNTVLLFDTQARDTLYIKAEEGPTLVDGTRNLQDAVMKAMGEIDSSGQESKTIFIEFTCDKNGNISDVHVEDRSIHPFKISWVEENFGSLGKWNPATVDGKPVKCKMRTFIII